VTMAPIRITAAALAVMAAFVVAFQATNAAFSSQTVNTGNAFASGSVVLTDNDAGVAMFNVGNMAPGDTATGCLEVTYSGSLDADVRVFGAIAGGTGLEAYLDLEIDRGSGTCAAFGTATAVWDNATDGDLGVFLAGHTNFATGRDTWAPTGGAPNDTVPYRFIVTLQDNNSAQAKSSTVGFTWEAQNS